MEVNVRDARRRLSILLTRAQHGDEVVIVRHGKQVARLVPPQADPQRRLPSLKAFRAAIQVTGGPLSTSVVDQRAQERY